MINGPDGWIYNRVWKDHSMAAACLAISLNRSMTNISIVTRWSATLALKRRQMDGGKDGWMVREFIDAVIASSG